MCEKVKFGSGETATYAMVCRGRHKRRVNCQYCHRENDGILCDSPIFRNGKPVKKRNGANKTCDRKLCSIHGRAGVSPDTHFCPPHYEIAKAAYERRQARKLETQKT